MKISKKILTAMLISAMLLPTLSACSTATTEPETAASDTAVADSAVESVTADTETAADEEEEKKLFEGVNIDYEGYEYRLLIRPSDRWIDDIYSEGLTGEVLNDAVFTRNQLVEETFNVKITYTESTDSNLDSSALSTIAAGDDAYDVIVPHGRAAFIYANAMTLLDWNKDLPGINLDASWWNQDARKSFSIYNKLYTMDGDVGYFIIGSADAMVFNKELMTDLGYGSPYEWVREGTWTYEKFGTLVASAASDLDGDGQITEDNDRFGYTTQKWIGPIESFATSGLRVVSKDETDTPYISFYSEKAVDVFNWYYGMIDSGNVFIDLSDLSFADPYVNIFEEGRALFMDMNMNDIIKLRTMEADFGIIPWPKYDESSDYCTNVDAGTNLFCIPITVSDPTKVSTILDAMAEAGQSIVIPAYYDVTLQGKTSRDDDSAEMLDIIKSALIFDLGYYNYDLVPVLQNEFETFAASSDRDLTSWYQKNVKVANATLKKVLAKYE